MLHATTYLPYSNIINIIKLSVHVCGHFKLHHTVPGNFVYNNMYIGVYIFYIHTYTKSWDIFVKSIGIFHFRDLRQAAGPHIKTWAPVLKVFEGHKYNFQ